MKIFAGPSTDLGRLSAAFGTPPAPAAPSAITPHFSIAAVPALGDFGSRIAQYVSQHCEADRDQLETWFGATVPHFDIIIAGLSKYNDGTGGAFHAACADSALYCDAKIVPFFQPEKTSALAVAEMVEVYEATLGGGWDCGASNGEGLSRVLANERHPKVMDDYAVASAWLNSTRPDYVNITFPSDRDTLSTACSVIFLNYLHYVLRYDWGQICRAAAASLAGTYQRLTGRADNPFPHFRSLLDNKFPPAKHVDWPNDNPWVDPAK